MSDITVPGPSVVVTERGEQFRARVRTWLLEVMTSRAGSDLESVETQVAWDQALYAAGFAGLTWPLAFGGQAMGPLEEYIFHEEAARAGAPEGHGRVGRILVGPLLIKHGSTEQQSRFLAPILRGEEVWCQGFSEPGAGSDLAAVSTRAESDGSEFRITGQKIWTSFAHDADRCLLLARTDVDAPRHHNLGMFLVNLDQPGVDVRPIRRITGDTTFSEIFFDGAHADRSELVGGATDGWAMAMSVLADERGPVEAITRYINMAGLVGLLNSCCGEPGAHDVDEVCARVEIVRWHALRSLSDLLAGRRDPQVVGTSKLMWSQAWQALSEVGLRQGCAEHLLIWQHQYLESRGASIFSGTSEIQRNIIAERILGLPR